MKGEDYEPPPCGIYHIRVLIPCYKEETHIVMGTLDAIRAAALPPGAAQTRQVCSLASWSSAAASSLQSCEHSISLGLIMQYNPLGRLHAHNLRVR